MYTLAIRGTKVVRRPTRNAAIVALGVRLLETPVGFYTERPVVGNPDLHSITWYNRAGKLIDTQIIRVETYY